MPVSPYDWSGPTERRDSVDKNLIRTISHRWDKVYELDNLNESQVSIDFTRTTGIGIGTQHPTIANATVISLETEEDNASEPPYKHWILRVTYSSAIDSNLAGNSSGGGPSHPQTHHQQKGVPPQDRQENPLLRPLDVKFSGSTHDFHRVTDVTGKLYANYLGDPYLPPLATPLPGGTWVIGRNYAFNSFPNQIINLQGRVNSRPLIIPLAGVAYPAYFVKLGKCDFEPVYENGIRYWRATFPLEVTSNFDKDGKGIGWATEQPEMGKRKFTYPAGYNDAGFGVPPKDKRVIEIIRDDSKSHAVTEPQFLDSYGRHVDTKKDQWWQYVGYTTFYKYLTADLNVLFI